MANFFKIEKEELAPLVRPAFNVGLLFDVPTSTNVRGVRGENILMGGQAFVHSFTGPGNSFKTDLILWGPMQCLNRYPSHRAIIYDTENSLKYARFNRIAQSMTNLKEYNFGEHIYDEDPLLIFVQKANVGGEDMFERIKDMGKEKQKNRKAITYTLPVRDSSGSLLTSLQPHHWACDSLSAFSVASVEEKIVDKNEIGDSGANTLFMKDGAAKTQMIMQLPKVTVSGAIYYSCTAHIGQKIEMDPYAPKAANLAFSKKGHKTKGAPEKFMYINDFLLEVMGTKPLVDKKMPIYPRHESDREENNDLFVITAVNSRNKNGPSGVAFPIIVSQAEGIKESLTHYAYLKEHDKFGIGGNDRFYHLDLLPDLKLQRTTIRSECDTNEKLQRVLEITTQMLQFRKIWRVDDYQTHCTPAELYQKVIDQGYDWDVLLDSRSYWMFKEDEVDQKPFLSTLDILELAEGRYHPYWLAADKKTVKPNHWELGDW